MVNVPAHLRVATQHLDGSAAPSCCHGALFAWFTERVAPRIAVTCAERFAQQMRTPGGEVAHAVGMCWAEVLPPPPTELLWLRGGGGVNVSCLAWCAGRPLRGNEAPRMCLKEHRLRIRIGLFVILSLNTMSSENSSLCREGDSRAKRGTEQATCQGGVSLCCVCAIFSAKDFFTAGDLQPQKSISDSMLGTLA